LWQWLGVVFVLSFAVLGFLGREIYLAAPPIPRAVATGDGATLFTGDDVQHGQQAWLSAGGQQLGTVWGHGSYVAPDWSADWLHREAVALRDRIAAQRYRSAYDALPAATQAAVDADVKRELRTNTYDATSQTVMVSLLRAAAIRDVAQHYDALFGDAAALEKLREQYAMNDNVLPRAEDRHALTAFFFWSAWSAATDRPGESGLSYTSNWPHEPLVGNTMTASSALWSVASIILLIAGIAGMVWYHTAHAEPADPQAPNRDPLLNAVATPSMKATRKYFFTVIGLILAQVAMGAITAHYAVEGRAFFGFPLSDLLPYVVSRTVHTQFGIFWIGNQGLEFTSMGRVWQVLLFVGLLFWLTLLGRALWPALKRPSETRGLIAMVFLSATCIGAFYATSLVWGQRTHYAMIEYWRWWLVHLWVEGFFEVFATAVVGLIFTRLGLVAAASANRAIVLETIVFLLGGILGTLHHLYWTGTPTSVIAVGAVFSALEVVPLALLGFEGWHNYKRSRAAPWVAAYRWPILCFVAVGFWNTVGAGLLGFVINPPASLYYVQGLNLTPAHGHAALFGVYGMLGIGLMLFCLRGLFGRDLHADRYLGWTFWGLNIGLAMMVFMSLLPAGIYQAYASVSKGLWFARSPEVVHSKVMEALVWLRVPGDVVFALGCAFLAVYALKLLRRGPRAAAQAQGVFQPT
jgi:nitric oxide reductase subunit B